MDLISKTIRLLETDYTDVDVILDKLDGLDIKSKGIGQRDLRILINVLTDPETGINQSSKFWILEKYLYFRGLVPSESIVSILGNIRVKSTVNRNRTLSQNFQRALIEWIVTIYSFLEEPDIIERLYGMIFNFLEFEYLRPKIAHLLFLATKKKHINPKRVNRLLNIYHKYGSSPEIVALLLLYQQFTPGKIFDTFSRVSEHVFSHPNPTYLNELIALRPKNEEHSAIQSVYDEQLYVEEFERKLKRRKKASVAVDYSSLVRSSEQGGIPSLEKLAQTINDPENSEDFSSLLPKCHGYRLLSYVIKESDQQHDKLNTWIALVLENLNEMDNKEIQKFFESIKSYTELSFKVPNSIVSELLLNKDLITNEKIQDYIFFFLQNLNSSQISKINQIGKLFEDKSSNATVTSYALYIDSISILIKKLALEAADGSVEITTLLNLLKSTIDKASIKLERFEYDRILVVAVIRLIRSLKEIPKNYLEIKHVVLPESLVYPLMFIADPISFSEICLHLNFAKEILKVAEPNDEVTRLTNIHNSYVVDICNIIWRNKAFDTSKSSNRSAFGLPYEFVNSLQNNISIFDQNSSFRTLFNIHSSPAFAGYSANYVKTLEEKSPHITVKHEGPLTQQSVQKLTSDPEVVWLDKSYEDLRIEILKELEALGYNGVSDLLFTHLKSLLNR